MFLLYLLILVQIVDASHYRGGTISYSIRNNANATIVNAQTVSVLITQRHSWNRLVYSCSNTNPVSGDIIGQDLLQAVVHAQSRLRAYPAIDARVRCTDYSAEFQYSTGESSITAILPVNDKIEYIYTRCCWIPLLPPDSASSWSLRFLINTHKRSDGTLNNSPKTTMNPIVQVELGKTHIIRIPMADSDGDVLRCRWGNATTECGSVCTPKGALRANPCELTYVATKLGYHAVALVIEDFDASNNVISAIPLQFLIHIVNATATTDDNCTELPEYIGERAPDSCIGIKSNTTFSMNAQIRIPCTNTTTTLKDILTISPVGLIKGNITRASIDRNLYTMLIEWKPTPDQYGIHQLCLTPVDSKQRTGVQSCLTFQVDVQPPSIIQMSPMGLVSTAHSTWTIVFDRNIIRPTRVNQVYIRFFQSNNNQEVVRIDLATDTRVVYQSRQVTFFTNETIWQQGEEYYILIDSGAGILNESCGVESNPISNSSTWIFQIEKDATTAATTDHVTTQAPVVYTTEQPAANATEQFVVEITEEPAVKTTEQSVGEITEAPSGNVTKKSSVQTTEQPVIEITEEPTINATEKSAVETTEQSIVVITEETGGNATEKPDVKTTEQSVGEITEAPVGNATEKSTVKTTEQSVTTQTPSPPQAECPQWFQFNRISNESTSLAEPNFTFCFTVESTFADVTIGANTWSPCTTWKLSGTADPFMDLYSVPAGVLLAQNDDGNSSPLQNCYAAILSYRLQRGDYRVVIRSPRCAFGKFELRLTTEIGGNF